MTNQTSKFTYFAFEGISKVQFERVLRDMTPPYFTSVEAMKQWLKGEGIRMLPQYINTFELTDESMFNPNALPYHVDFDTNIVIMTTESQGHVIDVKMKWFKKSLRDDIIDLVDMRS